MKRGKVVLLTCVFLASGCVTDKLAVFEGNVLTDDEMKPYLGKYRVVAATDDDGHAALVEFKDVTLELTKKGDTYHFEYNEPDEKSSGPFVLSKIPDSKANLSLFATPEVKSTGDHPSTIGNVFFITQGEKDTIQLWLMLGEEPIVKDFPFTQNASKGGFNSQELKEFLEKHADEFVAKNKARLTFKKTD